MSISLGVTNPNVLRKRALLALTVLAAALSTGSLFAAKPPSDPLTCQIDPQNGTTSVGVPITYTAVTQGGAKGRKTYSWAFSGPATPSVSDSQSQDVTYSDAGPFVIGLTVTDSNGVSCTDSTTTTVTGGNLPPVLDPIGNKSITEGDDLTFNVTASDPDSRPSALALSASNLPTGSTFTDNGGGNGTFQWLDVGPANAYTVTFTASDGVLTDSETISITVNPVGATGPTARGDAYATPVDKTLTVAASRVSGVLYNDFGGTPPLTAELISGPANGILILDPEGSFTYQPDASLADNDNDSFTYRACDSLGVCSDETTVNINILSDQPDFKIMMNYELGMHCTGFEFAYCCVLPPYNSILAQVVKPQANPNPTNGNDFPRLLEGSHSVGTDGLGRPTVVQAGELDGNGNFQTYMLEYFHDAQPRREGQGKVQTSTLISAVEGNSLFYHSTLYDSAEVLADGSLKTGSYEGADNVVLGDGSYLTPCATPGLPNGCADNYANGWLNHFYIYADLEGSNPTVGVSLEADKIRLGVAGHIEYPADVGAALQPMGPTGSAAGFDNVLTFSGDTGTVVYTQMKVLENLPVMLTSPHIWEALGLPLTPFEDSIDFFADPGLVDEDSIRPYVAMKARLHEANCDQDPGSPNYGICTQGPAVIGSNGLPVIGHGTAPIDIPNCERCHSVTDPAALNSPVSIRTDFGFPHPGNGTTVHNGDSLKSITEAEYDFWAAYYNLVPAAGDSDWYARLKSAAINMLALHDFDQGTGFTENWPASNDTNPETNPMAQNTRLGKESVICQKCHADNVIAVVKSATKGGVPIKPITEAIHWRHREISEIDTSTGLAGSIDFSDATGRSGGCQGCHPAHRSDGVMDGYPITLGGDNAQAESDNRLAAGGCFVGRDVHSNPMKDVDGAETPAHLNSVGQWLADNVFHNQAGVAGQAGHDTRGLWCTNCHTQLGQEMWKAEDCADPIGGDCLNNIRSGTLQQIADQVAGGDLNQVIAWLDPNNQDLHGTGYGDETHTIWNSSVPDAMVATIEVGSNGPVVSEDGDGDISVNILSFCTTPDCVDLINNNKSEPSKWRYPTGNVFTNENNTAVAVPFDAATDGRDHWLSPGEPHCADCHAAPFVEPSGNQNPYPPFNYPAKASLMRYSKGHQGISCQGCHESIHGLYPVTPTIDATSYAQAAALNPDGSHGPLKCAACHTVDASGVPTWMKNVEYNGIRIRTFDDAVAWAHTFTNQAPMFEPGRTCTNCHTYPKGGGKGGGVVISETDGGWLDHSFVGRVGRKVQDQAEIEFLGHVAGDPDTNGDGVADRTAQDIADTVCTACHSEKGGPSGAFLNLATCDNTTWKSHVIDGRLSEKVWEFISEERTGTTCGW